MAGLVFVMGGCRSTKKIRKEMARPRTVVSVDTTGTAGRDSAAKVPTAADLKADSVAFIKGTLAKLSGNRIDFETMSGKMKVHYEGSDGKDYEFNAFIRIRKDSVVWVSINAALGIEAFRVLVTPDSVKILDKLKKTVRVRAVSYLQEEVHLPVNFAMLQDLLVGNPIYLDTNNVAFYKKENGGAVSLLTAGDLFKNFLTLNSDGTPRHSKLDDTNPMRARTCDLTYGDYEAVQGGSAGQRFSTYRKISVAEKARADIEINYKQYKFNEIFNIPFSIPKNYRRK